MKIKLTFLFAILLVTRTASSQPSPLWISSYNSATNGTEEMSAMTMDNSGNIYVTGRSIVTGTYYDYATVKYNSAGVQQWAVRYNNTASSYDGATCIAVDDSGNVYVGGYSDGSGTAYDYATVKYNSAGVQQWVQRYNGPGNYYDLLSDIKVDASGNVYVTGSSNASASSNTDFATIKYNSAGVQQWIQRYNGPGNSNDGAASLAIDASGNVYVTGTSMASSINGSEDIATVKYNTSGVQQWVARYNGSANFEDYGRKVIVDAIGNVYVMGRSWTNNTNRLDYTTLKYNSSGVQQWVRTYNGPGNQDDLPYDIAVDASGNVYVTGGIITVSSGDDYFTIKYNSSGSQLWAAQFNGLGNGNDDASSLIVDAAGNVYVTGTCMGSGTSFDWVTVKYNSSGTQQWMKIYNGSADYWDFANAIRLDAGGNIIVSGTSSGITSGSDYTTIKYSQVTGITPLNNEIPQHFSLSQNYPNPFNPGTKIRFELPMSSFVKLIVFDALGRELETLVSENLSAGTYEQLWNADKYSDGVYFYKLTAGNFSETKRMILVK